MNGKKNNKKPSKWMAHGTGLQGKWGWGVGHWDPKLTQSDNGRRQPACHPFSRFAGIHVSVQFGAKTQG